MDINSKDPSGGSGPAEEERAQATKLVSTLLERQKEMASNDPFSLLKELTNSFGKPLNNAEKPREGFAQYQPPASF